MVSNLPEYLDLRHCDNMELMAQYPDKYFDLAIVDPPYGIGDFRQAKSRKKHEKINWNNAIPTKEYFDELSRVCKHRIIWGINYYTDHVKDVGRIVHDKTGGGHKKQLPEMSDADLASHDFGVNIKIYHYIWQGNAQGSGINWKNNGEDGRIHPCQKPVSLYKWLFMKYSKPGDNILDTHLGSASIAIAVHEMNKVEKMNLTLVGCELDEDYYNDAIKRVELATRQLSLI